jgi:hypothetical protein
VWIPERKALEWRTFPARPHWRRLSTQTTVVSGSASTPKRAAASSGSSTGASTARATAEDTVADFAGRLRDAVLDEFAGTAARSLQPAHVTVWLRAGA